MNNARLIDSLNDLVADTTLLYQRLRGFHWTVTGRRFFELHELFEKQYLHYAETIDELAERVLSLGGRPPVTLSDMIQRSSLEESATEMDADAMVAKLIEDLKSLHDRMGAAIDLGEELGDRGSVNLLDGERDEMEKTIWMLSAFLDRRPASV